MSEAISREAFNAKVASIKEANCDWISFMVASFEDLQGQTTNHTPLKITDSTYGLYVFRTVRVKTGKYFEHKSILNAESENISIHISSLARKIGGVHLRVYDYKCITEIKRHLLRKYKIIESFHHTFLKDNETYFEKGIILKVYERLLEFRKTANYVVSQDTHPIVAYMNNNVNSASKLPQNWNLKTCLDFSNKPVNEHIIDTLRTRVKISKLWLGHYPSDNGGIIDHLVDEITNDRWLIDTGLDDGTSVEDTNYAVFKARMERVENVYKLNISPSHVLWNIYNLDKSGYDISGFLNCVNSNAIAHKKRERNDDTGVDNDDEVDVDDNDGVSITASKRPFNEPVGGAGAGAGAGAEKTSANNTEDEDENEAVSGQAKKTKVTSD